MQAFCVVAVDLFVLITGYFSCTSTKKSILKPIRLVAQVIIFSEVHYFCRVIQGIEDLSVRHIIGRLLPCNYFVVIYSALYFLSPFINLMLNKMSAKSLDVLIFISFLIFSVEPVCVDILEAVLGRPLSGLCTISAFSGSDAGYTFVNFTLMYLIGGYLRLRPERSRRIMKKKRSLVSVILLNVVLLVVWAYVQPATADEYCNPLVIINAALIFEFFTRLNIKQSEIVNRAAAGSFTVFLTHSWIMRFFNVKDAVARPVPLLLLHILFVAIFCYLFGWICHELYFWMTEPIYKFLQRKNIFYVIDAEEKNCD